MSTQMLNTGVRKTGAAHRSYGMFGEVLRIFQFICYMVLSSIFNKAGYRQAVCQEGFIPVGLWHQVHPYRFSIPTLKAKCGSSLLSFETQLNNHHLHLETPCLRAADSSRSHFMPAATLASPRTLYDTLWGWLSR